MMNPLASPPYSVDSASLTSINSQLPVDPQMRALLASTWQVLDQPPPPSLREILAAYKQRGDGDREMLLAMLNAKSAEDQRLASVASLHRAMLEIRQTCEPSLTPPPQLQLPNGSQYPPPHNHFMHPPAVSYTPPPPQQPLDYPQHLRQACSELVSASKASLAATRGRPSSSSGRPSSSSEGRQRKRARNAQTAPQPNGVHFDTRPSPQEQPASELPPSPYSSTSQRSLSSEGSAAQHSQKPPRAMAIGSLLSDSSRGGGPAKMEVERDREDAWTNERGQRRSSADNSPRLVKAS